MKLIGITGSYSSGKSYILQYLHKQNFKTFSADEFLRNIYKEKSVQDEILKILPSLEKFDKMAIAKLIYNNEESRKLLENFVHPKVLKELLLFKENNSHEAIIIAEIPLLFEAGYEKYFDYIITAYCDDEIRLKRAKTRSDFNQEKFEKLREIQFSQEFKISKSDMKIDTNATEEEVKYVVDEFIKNLAISKTCFRPE